MKLGILTFHSQLNYGGVLQCWALKTALEGMGHEVLVVDRWLDKRNARLLDEFVRLGWKGWVKLLVRTLLGCGDFGKLLRTIRTIRFVRGLGLSKEHFYEWSEIECSNIQTFEHLDVLIVGSDQVWHCGNWGAPQVYLLEGAPAIRAISYAASFGMREVPAGQVALYRRGLGRFKAISCRETEGVHICRELGYEAKHVVDPTLLLEPVLWDELTRGHRRCDNKSRKLVCYFMDLDVRSVLLELEEFAVTQDCFVEVLTDKVPPWPFPKSAREIARNYRVSRVKICRSYGPKDFVKAFSEATWTLTDSFHAMMFSAIFGVDLRFLRPTSEFRTMMFARVEEFATRCIRGALVADNVRNALLSFERGEKITYDYKQIAAMRAESMKWLEDALK